MDGSLDLAIATIYGLLGLSLSLGYFYSPRLREEPVFHGITAVLSLGATALVAGATGLEVLDSSVSRLGARFLLYCGAGLAYAPAWVFLVLRYSEAVVDRILCPASRKPPPRPPTTGNEHWREIQRHLATLSADPSDSAARERLADVYARLGFFDSAAYEYQKAASWLERGYAHGKVLYKAARLLARRRKTEDRALPLLRRIIELYPKSCFAAYARRVVSHHEARNGIV